MGWTSEKLCFYFRQVQVLLLPTVVSLCCLSDHRSKPPLICTLTVAQPRYRFLHSVFFLLYAMLTADWRRLHNEELYTLHSSPNIIRVTKSRKMRCAARVYIWRRKDMRTGFWWGNLRKRDHLEVLGVDERIMLK